MGSIGIAGWIATLAFPILLALGWMRGELGATSTGVFAIIGLLAWLGLPHMASNGGLYVTPALALLDIVLVFVVFKGDVRIG
jgi:hypothetical protein